MIIVTTAVATQDQKTSVFVGRTLVHGRILFRCIGWRSAQAIGHVKGDGLSHLPAHRREVDAPVGLSSLGRGGGYGQCDTAPTTHWIAPDFNRAVSAVTHQKPGAERAFRLGWYR